MNKDRLFRAVGVALVVSLLAPAPAVAGKGSVGNGSAAQAQAQTASSTLEQAATKASQTGRKVALSLIALGFAIAAIVLAFKRDFKEAVVVFTIGVVAVLFAEEAGLHLIENLVTSLVG